MLCLFLPIRTWVPLPPAVTRQIASGNLNLLQYLQTHATECIRPGLQYFETKFGSNLSAPVSVFKAARLFSPVKVHEMKPVASDVDILSAFPFLNDSVTISNLKSELPSYLAKASDVSPDFDMLEWWKWNSDGLPHWSSAAMKVLAGCTTIFCCCRARIFNSYELLHQQTGESFGGLY